MAGSANPAQEIRHPSVELVVFRKTTCPSGHRWLQEFKCKFGTQWKHQAEGTGFKGARERLQVRSQSQEERLDPVNGALLLIQQAAERGSRRKASRP